MNRAPIVTAALFAALILSGVMMFRSGFKPKENEREILARWPAEVSKAFEAYDLDKLDGFFVDDFVDQENTTKQSYKAFLQLEKNV